VLFTAWISLVCLFVVPACASAATFANTTPITIPDGVIGPASPYPSSINVSGLTGTFTDISATITGLSHAAPADLDVLLVEPHGSGVILMSDAPQDDPFCVTPVTGVDLTFDSFAAERIPPDRVLSSGTQKPTDVGFSLINCGRGADDFTTEASSIVPFFRRLDPNGVWSLYVRDDDPTDGGSIAGGWSLGLTNLPARTLPPPSTGRRAAALAKCKKKHTRKKRRRCRRRAMKLPL
jgi:hypothetical protein